MGVWCNVGLDNLLVTIHSSILSNHHLVSFFFYFVQLYKDCTNSHVPKVRRWNLKMPNGKKTLL